MTIKPKTTYCTRRAITFYPSLDYRTGNPVCHGNPIKLQSGVMVCLADMPPTFKGKRGMMTTVYRGEAVFAWIDADSLATREETIANGLTPCFA